MEGTLSKYKDYFPEIEDLYPYQVDVIKKLRTKTNTLAVIPTGGGKSLLYQLMSLEFNGVTIVISPLLALMKEQVDELNFRRIPSLALNSSIPFVEQRKILRNFKNENYKLLYVSPERLQNPFFRASLIAAQVSIDMLVIDEAHCISQWGSGFRPDYSQILEFHSFLKGNNKTPFLFCLTATLSSKAKQDIVKEFQISANNVVSADVLRSNLKLNFEKVENEEEKALALRKFLSDRQPKKTVAYLYSQRECENYASEFSDSYSTAFYHADLSAEERQDVYDAFKKSKIELLFATTAFGMGINIPDIESVIHLQIPNSIEEYYQQVGRGWRRKDITKDCNCLALWSEVNFERRAQRIEGEKWDGESFNEGYKLLTGGAKIKFVGQVVNKDKAGILESSYNLQLLRFKLEKHNVIRTIGELNGTPLSIEMIHNTHLWKKIRDCAESGMDGFSYVSKELQVRINDIMTHLYEQDLAGNIKKLPAMKKDLYFEVLRPEISDEEKFEIISEMNKVVDHRLIQLEELKKLFSSGNDHEAHLIKALS
ncbi:MAG TPA: RecQ family ATP-dependent DNA helicase [Cyclobacteriaceae bacterium]|nr:RecQ family ATP-dependent DNA helicase [Cyclobacteriaceae bacterium]